MHLPDGGDWQDILTGHKASSQDIEQGKLHNKQKQSPIWFGSVDRASAWEPRGPMFDSSIGYLPRLQAGQYYLSWKLPPMLWCISNMYLQSWPFCYDSDLIIHFVMIQICLINSSTFSVPQASQSSKPKAELLLSLKPNFSPVYPSTMNDGTIYPVVKRTQPKFLFILLPYLQHSECDMNLSTSYQPHNLTGISLIQITHQVSGNSLPSSSSTNSLL